MLSSATSKLRDPGQVTLPPWFFIYERGLA